MYRNWFLAFLVLVLAGGVFGYKMYNKPHVDMSQAKPDATMTAQALYEAYEQSEDEANNIYLGKTIQITGEINAINLTDNKIESIGLETGDMLTGLTCLLDEVDSDHRADFKKGERVTFNCKCNGKLMDIELNRCVEIK